MRYPALAVAGVMVVTLGLCAPAVRAGGPDDVTIAELKKNGAAKIEGGFLTEVGFVKGTNPEPLLPLVKTASRLRAIQFGGTKITDAGLAPIAAMAQLEYVGLINTAVGDRGLSWLTGLKKLTALNVAESRVTDAGLVHVAAIAQLEELNLRNDAISDAGLAHLVNSTRITGLNLTGTKITDAGLLSLQKMRRLTKLTLTNTAVTDAGVKRAKSFMPFFSKIYR